MDKARGIREYPRLQKSVFLAPPGGLPVTGSLSSRYGRREGPVSGEAQVHSGIDIPAPPGDPHPGHGFSTIYAHNRKNAVKVEERVQRGQVIAYVGSTDRSTGPHLHYEGWKNGKTVNPEKFLGD